MLRLLKIWNNWMNGPEPAENKPQAYKDIDKKPSGHIEILFGMTLHMFLWFLTRLGQLARINSLSIWAAQKRIRYDDLWYEPHSCGLTSAFTDLGISHLENGDIGKAIECLGLAWRVYPCPHNTSYGIKLKLYKRLRILPEAQIAINEYKEMWYKFKSA